MKNKLLLLLAAILYIVPCLSQSEIPGSTSYNIEASGSAATDGYTPFWIVSNKYGIVPLEAENAYLRAGVFHNQMLDNGFQWSAGVDMVTSTPRYRNAYIQQLYAGVRYRFLDISIGSKENYSSLWDRELSSGDIVSSANARPIPEINISIPRFTPFPFTNGIIQFRGNFAVGRSFDTDYIKHFINEKQHYTTNTLWHHKSLQVKLIDPQSRFPLTATIGVRHHAQWGGTSTDPEVGVQPHSLKDFLRIVAGKSGGTDAYHSDRHNILGNHYGSYDLKIGYLTHTFDMYVYKQHYFDDVSGMELYNINDGLYGFQAVIHGFTPLRSIVFEFINTRNQSGPVHYIIYDHDIYHGYGGGNDDYYNSNGYRSGVSYFNRSTGSPLLTSPEYNKNGDLTFKNNRIQAFHLGIQGYISQQMSYRILATSSEGWGTNDRPFLKKESNISCATKISYCHPKLENWLFSGEVATDFGSTLYGDNLGVSITISKSGILKKW
jgi:hypothetical protein